LSVLLLINLYLEQINNKAKYEICDSTDETTLADKYLEIEIFDAHTQLVGTSWGSLEFLAYQNGPAYIYKYKNGGKFIGGEVRMPESITYASPVINNYLTFENSKDYISSINVIVRGVSGYFYILNNYNENTIKYKIQKGEYASAYLQQDGTINVYIVQNTTTYKYNFSIDTTNKTYIQNSYEVISNCEYVYEGINRILFIKNRTTWSVVYPETTTSE